MSRRLFLFRIQILNIFSEKKLEYKVTICCNKNDDHKKVVSPFNLIELWFFLPLKLSTKLRFILLEKLSLILRKNYFEMQIGVESKVCFSPLCHSLLTNLLRFNVSLKEIVKMLHLCQKKIQRFLQIIECVKNLKIRDFLQNVECVFANMFGLSLTFFWRKIVLWRFSATKSKYISKNLRKDLMLRIMLRFFDVDVSVVHLSVALPTFVKSVKPIKSNLRFFTYFFVLTFPI
jgi:hypothetical protein